MADEFEKLGYQNRFVKKLSQTIEGADCFSPFVSLNPDSNLITLELTEAQFTRMFSALITGADITHPDESHQIQVDFLKGLHCPPVVDGADGDCFEYSPSASFISYFPDNPFVAGDKSPGWNKEAWFRWSQFDSLFPDWIDTWIGGIIDAITGYQTGDILFNIESVPINPIDALINGGFLLPKIEIRFSGTGTVEVELLSFPLGGKAIIELDQEPNALDILTGGIIDPDALLIELNRDIFNFPPDEYPIINIEIPVENPGNHTLYIVFIPIVDDSLLPVGFGGGIRSVELCGFEETPMPGIEQLFFEDCTLKVVTNGEVQEVTNFQNIYDCIEALMATQAEIKQAIIDAQEELAARLLSAQPDNTISGIEIDKDFKPKLSTSTPTDDPDTVIDEARSAAAGGAIGIRLGYNKFYANLKSFVDAGLADSTIMQRLSAIYKINGDMAAAVSEWRTDYIDGIPVLQSFTSALDSQMYCEGATLNSIAAYIVTLSPANLVETALLINGGFEAEQISDWYTAGTSVPSLDYVAYSCVPIEPEQFVLNGAQITSGAFTLGAQIGKLNHRILIEVSGKVTHPSDGSYQDFFYHVSSAGIKTFLTSFTPAGQIQFNAPFSNPPQSKVPWNEDGIYAVTMETTAADIYAFRRQIQVENFGSGSYTIKFTDLGEV